MKRIAAFFMIALITACTTLSTPFPSVTVPSTNVTSPISLATSSLNQTTGLSVVPETFPSATTIVPANTIVSNRTPTLTLVPATGLPPQPTNTPNPIQAKQQDEIKIIIEAYFAIRYDALCITPSVDIHENMFGDLVYDSDATKDFLATETAKLAVERKWHELHKQLYAAYKYSLNYTDIAIDLSNQLAEITLVEHFEITCQRTMESNPENPKACASGALTHQIILQMEQGEWKMVSDEYRDSLWRQFRKPGLSTEEILQNINLTMQKLEKMPSPTP